MAYLVAQDSDLLRERGFDGKEGVELTSKSFGMGLTSDIAFGFPGLLLVRLLLSVGALFSPCRLALWELASPQPV